ncbi:MAG: rod shape-determining protein RodA [Candidatus Cloacimonetes bacterium]|nr:rod shape-determining protein RodA [Candidatus Cloacimonadota bacterium]
MVLKNVKKFDWVILLYLMILLIIGVTAIFSSSATKIGDNLTIKNYYLKQIIWIVISLLFMLIIIKIPYHIIEILIVPAYIISLIFLIIVFFLPAINGSHRWIKFGFFQFQASEVAKLSTILVISKAICKQHQSTWKIMFKTMLIGILPFLLILFEPDLGTSLIFLISILTILSVSDVPIYLLILLISPFFSIIFSFSWIYFVIYLLLLSFIFIKMKVTYLIIAFSGIFNTFIFLITPFFWNHLKFYQQNRILTFLDPSKDPFGAGYQIIQSKIAIGSGGIFGKGFLEGTQKNLNFLPENHTDFIFSVIGEEFGFFGCVILLLFYFLFLFRILRNIELLKRREKRYATVGIVSYLSFQIFINIGMNIGIVPATGIPLPFISYGGSNLLINLIAVGLILKYINERSVFE